MDREATLHRRRKKAIVSLLAQFERDIEPLLSDREKAEKFKKSCRCKLNALTWEAIELMKLQPGESLNEHAADLAGELAFEE